MLTIFWLKYFARFEGKQTSGSRHLNLFAMNCRATYKNIIFLKFIFKICPKKGTYTKN